MTMAEKREIEKVLWETLKTLMVIHHQGEIKSSAFTYLKDRIEQLIDMLME